MVEVSRIERLISSWDENSQASAINRNAGIIPSFLHFYPAGG